MAAEQPTTANEYILHHLTFLSNKEPKGIVDFSVIHLDTVFFSVLLAIVFAGSFYFAARGAKAGVPRGFQSFVKSGAADAAQQLPFKNFFADIDKPCIQNSFNGSHGTNCLARFDPASKHYFDWIGRDDNDRWRRGVLSMRAPGDYPTGSDQRCDGDDPGYPIKRPPKLPHTPILLRL